MISTGLWRLLRYERGPARALVRRSLSSTWVVGAMRWKEAPAQVAAVPAGGLRLVRAQVSRSGARASFALASHADVFEYGDHLWCVAPLAGDDQQRERSATTFAGEVNLARQTAPGPSGTLVGAMLLGRGSFSGMWVSSCGLRRRRVGGHGRTSSRRPCSSRSGARRRHQPGESVPGAVRGPASVPFVGRLPPAEPLRQIPPRDPGPFTEEDPADHPALTGPPPTTPSIEGQMRLEGAPFLVRQITTAGDQLHGRASRKTHDPPDTPQWKVAGDEPRLGTATGTCLLCGLRRACSGVAERDLRNLCGQKSIGPIPIGAVQFTVPTRGGAAR